MSSERLEVFVVCKAAAVARGEAKAFSLSRLEAGGGARPFPILVVRTQADSYIGYVNACPHQGTWLNIGAGEFFSDDQAFLKCGRHGAAFEIDTGMCVEGPCAGQSLEPIALAVVGGDVCICGVALAEEDGLSDLFNEDDETMETMIHPD